MPNWCNQQLTIKGDKAELNRFVLDTTTTDDAGDFFVSFNHLIPCPTELTETMSGCYGNDEKQKELEKRQAENVLKYGFKDWYDWANFVWGTKWGAGDIYQTIKTPNDETLYYSFQSAWSPASGLIRGISMLYPTLTFGMWFTEEANFFAGWQVFKNGEEVEEYEIDPTPPNYSSFASDDDWQDAYEQWFEDMTDQLAKGLDEAMKN
jgi:hypothetical protein